MVDSCQEKTGPPHPFYGFRFRISSRAQTGTGPGCATFDHSDIRGFNRMTYFRLGTSSVYQRKFDIALFHSSFEGSPERGRVPVSTLDVFLRFSRNSL